VIFCRESVLCMSPFFFVRVEGYAGPGPLKIPSGAGPAVLYLVSNYLIQFSKNMPLHIV
jgi:hypothetical protein